MDFALSPNRIPWPPVIYGGLALVGLGLEAVVPTAMGFPRSAGLLVAGLGLLVDLSAIVTLARARTNVLPHRAADRLVTHGPFAFSRNPIYVGNTILVAGLGLAVDSLFVVAAAFVAALLTHRLAVLREERHLAARFGPAWSDYAGRVPRWLGWPKRTAARTGGD